MDGFSTLFTIRNTRDSAESWTEVQSFNTKLTQNYSIATIYLASADTSPYAQTGVSIWDLRGLRLGERNMLVVVHDIERINPNIVDLYDL